MKKTILITLLSINVAFATPTANVAILLDTSGSMQGLIDQVRDGLWQTLNNLGEIKKDGKKAELRLALFEYGSGTVLSEANHIQMLSPLTTDHTKIAENLFATKTTGSLEYAGAVISRAVSDLDWSTDREDFNSIVIAGNETINQGPVKPLDATFDALQKDILVNSIFAGSETIIAGDFDGEGCVFCPTPTIPAEPSKPRQTKNPIFSEWESMAKAGSGETINIDHNNSIPYIESPFDTRIVEITIETNKTFLPFGKVGQSEYDRMLELDRNIRNSGAGSYIGWVSYRGGSFGSATNAKWDLVTAMVENTEFDLSAVSETHLPKELKGLSLREKIAIVQSFIAKRKKLDEESKELNEKRRVFVEAELRELQGADEQNFAAAFKGIIIKQLIDKGFEVK